MERIVCFYFSWISMRYLGSVVLENLYLKPNALVCRISRIDDEHFSECISGGFESSGEDFRWLSQYVGRELSLRYFSNIV